MLSIIMIAIAEMFAAAARCCRVSLNLLDELRVVLILTFQGRGGQTQVRAKLLNNT